MRWLILALSLGTTLATLWRGITLFLNLGTRAAAASTSPFWWAVILCSGSLFGFIGGVLAFNHKMVSLLFLYAATIMTFFGYPASRILAYSFAVISILTTVYLIMHKRSKYKQRYGFSADEYSYEEPEKDSVDDEQGAASKQKMPKRRSTYSMPQKSDSLIIKPPQRQRETKVCLSCGIDVPTPYKYCPLCGMELYTSAENKVNVVSGDAGEDEAEEKKDETIKIYGVEADTQTHDVKHRFKYHMFDENKNIEEKYEDKNDESFEEKYEDKDENIEINESPISDKSGEVEVVPVVRKASSETSDVKESGDVSFKPINAQAKKQRNLEVDSSYQSFGRYTQSRKKRKVSTFQRTLLIVLAVFFVGAVGSFMYRGINRVPPPDRIEITQILPELTEDITSNLISIDATIEPIELAVPGVGQNQGTLPYMEVVPPRQVITTGNSVNLRENHTTTSRAVTRIQANNTYTLMEQWKADNASSLPAEDRNLPGDGTWYKIQAGNNTGWIYGQFALPLDGRATSLPGGYTDALLNSFGSNREEIEGKLGNPRQQNRGDTIILEYTGLRITLQQNRVQNIQISGRGHNLLNGLAVGMTFDDMSKIIGMPNRFQNGALSYLETANRGIVIRRENDGRVRSISVGNI